MSLYRAESKLNYFKIFTIGDGTYPLFQKESCHLLDTICPQRLCEFGVLALFLDRMELYLLRITDKIHFFFAKMNKNYSQYSIIHNYISQANFPIRS